MAAAKSYFYIMRSRYLPVLFIVAFTILAIYVSGEKRLDSFETNKEMIVFRKIGHEILLNAGDSRSRVLPIKKISAREFRISFENPVSLIPDSVVNIVKKIAKENKLSEHSVNVKDCQNNETVYGFTVSLSSDDGGIVPCLGRELPKNCYYIEMLFPASQWKGLRNWYYAGAVLGVLTLLFFLLKLRNKRKFVPGTASGDNNGNKSVVQIGKYVFDPEQQCLELNGEKTALTNKEARVLYILSTSPNTLIERDLLQKEVWENEGVIVTRSLDMFISKLRKKLSGDTNIKIVNAHGKGYKLEV